jgi:hypothetical protein
MKKFFVSMLMCLALVAVMPAFAATAGPEDPVFAIDATPLAGAVELCPAIVIGEKEVIPPLGRSTAQCVSNDTSLYDTMIEPDLEASFLPQPFLNMMPPAPPGY